MENLRSPEPQAKISHSYKKKECSANKSCLLQVVHTKAIAALTQFCDFCLIINEIALSTACYKSFKLKGDTNDW